MVESSVRIAASTYLTVQPTSLSPSSLFPTPAQLLLEKAPFSVLFVCCCRSARGGAALGSFRGGQGQSRQLHDRVAAQQRGHRHLLLVVRQQNGGESHKTAL